MGVRAWIVLWTLVVFGAHRAESQTREIVQTGKSATALVDLADEGKTATAFCIDPQGFFVTNHHVVDGLGEDDTVQLILNVDTPQQVSVECKVIRSDKDTDLALLRSVKPGKFTAFELGKDADVFETMQTVVFGFPFGKGLSVDEESYPAMSISVGRITSIRRKNSKTELVQLDAEINPGNSGGPVIDPSGKLVGIVSFGVFATGVNFAVPVDQLTDLLRRPDVEIQAPDTAGPSPSDPQTISVTVTPLLEKLSQPSVDALVTLGDAKPRTIALKATAANQFSATFQPVPQDAVVPVSVDADVTFSGGEVRGKVTDETYVLGESTHSIAATDQMQRDDDGKHRVVTVDGKEHVGVLDGLKKVDVDLGTTSAVLDLSQATAIDFETSEPSQDLSYTIVIRDKGKEIHRFEHGASSLVDKSLIAGTAYQGSKKILPMPAELTDFLIAAGGQRALAVMGKAKKIAVLDTSNGKLLKVLALSSDDVLVAATLKHFLVFDRSNNVVERWSLKTLKREQVSRSPFDGVVKAVASGYASEGPVLVFRADGTDALARATYSRLDIESLQKRELQASANRSRARLSGSFRDFNHLRAAANGGVFGMWCTSHSPQGISVFSVSGETISGLYEHTSVGHVCPGPDGMNLFTGSAGVYSIGLKKKSSQRTRRLPCIPSSHPKLYVSIPSEPGAQRNMGSEPFKGMKAQLQVVGSSRSLLDLPDLELGKDPVNRSWAASDFSLDKRVFLCVEKGVIISVPFDNDRVVFHPFDIEKKLKETDLDYFYVASTPPRTFSPGTTYRYPIVIASNQPAAEFQLSTGPDGMKVSKSGIVTWKVPKDFSEPTVDVIVSISSSGNQSSYETFTLYQ